MPGEPEEARRYTYYMIQEVLFLQKKLASGRIIFPPKKKIRARAGE
jgi:hypothetical protein